MHTCFYFVGKGCSKWVFDECKVNGGGVCGSGKKIGRRTGSNCAKREKIFSCTIPCESNDMMNNKMNKNKKKRAGGKGKLIDTCLSFFTKLSSNSHQEWQMK